MDAPEPHPMNVHAATVTPVLTETQELPSEDGLLPVLPARPPASREPPPAPLRR